MSNVSFDFYEKKYHIYAFVEQTCSSTHGDYRHYTTVALRFEGMHGQGVFSGTAIAVPEDWRMKFNNDASKIKVIKTGVQLALERAINDFLEHQLFEIKYQKILEAQVKTRYHDIASAFWEAFLPHIEEI